ncbi:MAG: serpin family protein [Clostridia bacterium]|nr:serpin family protein [Clostridia bacterium]
MKNKKLTILPLALCVILSGATGCNTFTAKQVSANELSKTYTRAASESVSVTDDFKASFSSFSLNMFRETVKGSTENKLLSPLSAALCLALVNNGANGETRAQLEGLLGMETDALNRAMYAYTSTLYTADDCKLSLANSIWMKEGALQVNPEFLQTNADWYNAQAYAAPFDTTTVQDINNWCHNQTTGKISKILDNIPRDAVMYLINAVDFDAKWQEKYESKDISNGVFHNYDGRESDVKMLHSQENRYFLDENSVGFTKNYMGGKYSFMALLPDEGVDIYEYIDSLNEEKWAGLWESADTSREDYEYREVHAQIPEFSYEVELSLNETLQALGVTDMFDPMKADFSRIDSTQLLWCDTVKQKAMIELDRNGTKAAAVTWAGMKVMSAAPAEPLYITLDRPFVYAIIDNTHKLPIFIGAVTNL